MDNFDLRNYLKDNLLIEEMVKDLSKQEVMGIGFTSKEDSLSLFDAFGVGTTAGLSRQECEDYISNLHSEGKTEEDDAFIGGLVNFAGSTLYQFFNLQALKRPNNLYRLIPHESLHVARNLISFFENPKIDPSEEEWWNNPENTYTDLKDASEEFFAEVLERATEVAFTRYDKIK